MSGGVIYFPNKNGMKKIEILESGTFTVPSFVDTVYVLAVGGGAGGSIGGSSHTLGNAGGGGGGVLFAPMNVVPNESLTITIGGGGQGAQGSGNPAGNVGSPGQNTVISGSISSLKSPGGLAGNVRQFLPAMTTSDEEDTAYANAGTSFSGTLGTDATGGGASYGDGGNARVSVSTGGQSALPNSGGGGGGSAVGNAIGTNFAGSGGSGRVHIYYFENE